LKQAYGFSVHLNKLPCDVLWFYSQFFTDNSFRNMNGYDKWYTVLVYVT